MGSGAIAVVLEKERSGKTGLVSARIYAHPGGDININTPNGFIVAAPLENNDITANAFFGRGGKVTITTKSIFGFVPRTRADIERFDPNSRNPNNLQTSCQW